MYEGSCMCGGVKFELTEEPLGTMLCHCTSCHKNAGANGSTNLVVSSKNFHHTGDTREWSRDGVSGQRVHYYSCAVCPTIIFVRPEVMGDNLILKTGLLESKADAEKFPPKVEIFVKDRIAPWCERGDGVVLKDIN
ncbi:Mss4-like protein [Xylaria arbuscula]|nr:Mss4-like protein [Xylaria arbuscula]